jgi:nucleoside transporter
VQRPRWRLVLFVVAVCPVAVLRTLRKLEFVELLGLFFLQGAALGIWFVPLSPVLDAHGYQSIKPLAFATSALAAFLSPLFFGAVADRHVSPVRVLRWLGMASALTMALATAAIGRHFPSWVVLGLIQVFALCASPTWSITSAIVFARLQDAQSQFGPIRSLATIGWIAGCGLVSLLNADATTTAGYTGAVLWLLLAGYTFLLPVVEPPKSAVKLTWHERLGLDALVLLVNRDHRIVFLTVGIYCIPLAAFYPYTPPHLQELGLLHTSAWLSLGQISEVFAMFTLGGFLMRWRLKWIFCLGLTFGVLRFAFSALNTKGWLLAGVALHGVSYTFVFITAQIYLDARVDPQWRTRAQALLSLVNGGIGNLLGFLGTGWWFATCTTDDSTRWPLFWGVLSVAVFGVMVLFLTAYRGLPKPVGRIDA